MINKENDAEHERETSTDHPNPAPARVLKALGGGWAHCPFTLSGALGGLR